MSLSAFHPAVARWFQERLGEPTPVQTKGWEAIRRERTLSSRPSTGSGKTLAAFLIELDELLRESLRGALPDETRVVYVSPLKALSADIHKNLAEPRREIRRLAEEMGHGEVRITAAVRSGDTPASERASMLRNPAPHSRNHPRVALPASHGRTKPQDAEHGADGDRGRNPRRGRLEERCPSRAEPGAPGTCRGA